MLNRFLFSLFVYHVSQQQSMSIIKMCWLFKLKKVCMKYNDKFFVSKLFNSGESRRFRAMLRRFVEREIVVRSLRHERRSKRSKTQRRPFFSDFE
jgi:hypothetical protein